MSVLVDRMSRLLVQGMGKHGTFHAVGCRDYGTNVEEGKRMLAESGLNFTTADTMGEAATSVVRLAGGAQYWPSCSIRRPA